ncbi:Protein of unknown function [Bacillus mobilis]
MGAYE